MMVVFMASAAIILIVKNRRILIDILVGINMVNRMTMSCVITCMDQMIVGCIVWPSVRLLGLPTGLRMRIMMCVRGTHRVHTGSDEMMARGVDASDPGNQVVVTGPAGPVKWSMKTRVRAAVARAGPKT